MNSQDVTDGSHGQTQNLQTTSGVNTIATGGMKTLNVVIVGGSLAGLMAAILLKRQGHNITVLEQALSSEREGMAAGISLTTHIKRFFDEQDRLEDVSFGFPSPTMKFIDSKTLETKTEWPYDARMTTWDATYYRLRANFDGLSSEYCEKPPDVSGDRGTAVFNTGKRVIDVQESSRDHTQLVVTAEDLRKAKSMVTYTADLVIAAEGANSSLRRTLQPHLQREEPGYLIWRSTVPTSTLSKSLLKTLEGRGIIYPISGHYTYVVIYTIPGSHGAVGDGERCINVVWYHWPSSQSHVRDVLTDIDGHSHRTTLPKGKMRPEIWQRQKEIAKRIWHPEMYELVEKTEFPFVSVASSFCSQRASFLDDRLFLVGDALVQLQPNSGQGTSFAANTTMSLCDIIEVKSRGDEDEFRWAISAWEQETLARGERERLRSIQVGSLGLCTYYGMARAMLRYLLCLLRQRLWKWFRGWWAGKGRGSGGGKANKKYQSYIEGK